MRYRYPHMVITLGETHVGISCRNKVKPIPSSPLLPSHRFIDVLPTAGQSGIARCPKTLEG